MFPFGYNERERAGVGGSACERGPGTTSASGLFATESNMKPALSTKGRPTPRSALPAARNFHIAIAALALLCGCMPIAPEMAKPVPPATSRTAPATTGPAASSARATPIPARIIEISGNCKRTEEDGFREDATMRVAGNDVRTLNWKLWVARRGTCSFELADFRQTRKVPHIELVATDGSGCKLMVWQDPRRVTLAHANCEKRCTPGIYEQAWPVMFDPASGRCAQTR